MASKKSEDSGTGGTTEGKEKLAVSIREFARILGVSHPVVIRAMKGGKRLRKSVIHENGNPKIIVYDGCIEWRDHKDYSKDRGTGVTASADLPEEIMPIELSVSIDRHYSALIKKVEFLRETGELVSAEKFRTEAFQAARAVRDAILGIPVATNREIFGILVRLLSSRSASDSSEEIQKAADAAAGECRQLLKKALTKSLQNLADYLIAPSSEEASSDS